jgi:hypothetical protein
MKQFAAATLALSCILAVMAPDAVLSAVSGTAHWVYETNVVQYFDAAAWSGVCFP